MHRLLRWSRSWRLLAAFNASLLLLSAAVGCDLASRSPGPPAAAPPPGPRDDDDHLRRILTGNLRASGLLLAGACTLGSFTLAALVWNGVTLGAGASALVRARPDAAGLLLRYLPIELAAFLLVAATAEHLAAAVLRCLATGEPLVLTADAVALLAALALLWAAAVIEADVTRHVAATPW